MKAILIDSSTEDNTLVWQETDDPTYNDDEVLVDIHAAALNRADLSQRAGNYPPPPGAPNILGLEMAGTIAEVGSSVEGWSKGDRVCALLPGGGYAERVAVPAGMLMRIPANWSFEEAAAVPEVFLTAYVNLFMEAGLQPGETVLMHGGASGVGTAGIQMAHQKGCKVVITAGTDDKLASCRELGANLAINYKQEDFAERIEAELGEQSIDVILDIVGGPYLENNLRLLGLKGRLIFISMLGGSVAEINLGSLMGRRLMLKGSVLRPRTIEEKIEIKENFQRDFWSLLLDGTIQPIIDSVYPIAQANDAHTHMQNNLNTGKIILKVRE